MFQERNLTRFYCKKCKKRISKAHKKRHQTKYHNQGDAPLVVPSMAQLRWFNIFLYRLPNILNKDVAVISPLLNLSRVNGVKNLQLQLLLEQQLKQITPGTFLAAQIPISDNKISFKQFEKKCSSEKKLFYSRWKGSSLLDSSIITMYKNNFQAQHRNDPLFWFGAKGSFFGIHRDAYDELIVNYLVFGKKKWWVIKKQKERQFKGVMKQLIGEQLGFQKHIFEHERIWMDGDWLSQQYPELEVVTIVQQQNQFVVLNRSDIYHWGVNLDITLVEINVIKRGKQINHETD